ncbi:MAG: hypothetical protein QXQ38_05875 [Archaeoglobaceae archaeon]
MICIEKANISKKDDLAAYYYLRRHGDEVLLKIRSIAYQKIRIKEAAKRFEMGPLSFLILIGHFKKLGVIREVRIL